MPINNTNLGLTFTKSLLLNNEDLQYFENNENNKLLYTRGFLFCKNYTPKITNHFKQIDCLNGYKLFVHSKLDVDVSSNNGTTVYILGTAWFTNKAYECLNQTESQILLESYLKQENDFYTALDYLAGRYVVILSSGGGILKVITDVGALKSVYYNKNMTAIASHLELLKDVCDAKTSKLYQELQDNKITYSYAYPANETIYDSLYFLVPNFELNLKTKTLSRFFPREKLEKSNNIYAIRTKFLKNLKYSFENLKKKNKRIAMSLTAGKDSRVTYYAIKDYKDEIIFFTENRDSDLEKTQKMAFRENLNWIGSDLNSIHYQENEHFHHFNKTIFKNVFPKSSNFALRSQFWNYNLFGNEETIHIHSNVAECARGRDSIVEYPYFSDKYNFEMFFDTYVESMIAWKSENSKQFIKNGVKNCPILKQTLQNFFELLDLEKVNKLNYNPWDLLYIEQRQAMFLSQSHVANDISFESVSLLSSREALNILWTMPEQYINYSSLLYNCILNEFDEVNRAESVGTGFVSNSKKAEKLYYKDIYGGKILCQKLKTSAEKVEYAKQVLEINSTILWAGMELVKQAVINKEIDKAYEYFKKYVVIHKINTDIYYANYVCNYVKSDLQKLKELINALEQNGTEGGWLLKWKSNIAYREKRIDEAIELAKQSFELTPDDMFCALSYIYILTTHKKENAEYVLENQMKHLYNKSGLFYYYLANLKQESSLDLARYYIKEAFKLEPTNQSIQSLYEKLVNK